MGECRVICDRLQSAADPVKRREDRRHQRCQPQCLFAAPCIVDVDHRIEVEHARRHRQHRSELGQHRHRLDRRNLDHGEQFHRQVPQFGHLGPEHPRLLGGREPTRAEEEPDVLERTSPRQGGGIVFAVVEEAAVAVDGSDRRVSGDDAVEPRWDLDELLSHVSSLRSSTARINIDSINVDRINDVVDDGAMSTLIRSTEAASLLNVSKSTLYAYVSRGRLSRTTAPDGRTSLFSRDEVERLAERSRRTPPGPRATIDVQISSAVTTIDESSVRYRSHDVVDLAAGHRFEDAAELLWSAPGGPIPSATSWPALAPPDRTGIAPIEALRLSAIAKIATASHVLADLHPDDSAGDAARRLLLAVPVVLGSHRRTGRYAQRVAAAWCARATSELVDAIDMALVLLADHELATSTLAVRIAASVRASPYVAFTAGLACMDGALHGAASAEANRFLAACGHDDPATVIARLRLDRQPVPGFGHKVYRGVDPRFTPLLDCVRLLDPDTAALVDAVVTEAGRVMSPLPNVDLALGALTMAAGLSPNTPIFAIARIAGWGAHYEEEVAEAPVRFRGVATPRR